MLATAPPELVRHSLVVGLSGGAGDAQFPLVLWAGARATDWEAGDGQTLREVASSFAARVP